MNAAGNTDATDRINVSYMAEYATQSDSDSNPLSYDADYYNVEGGLTFAGVTVKLGTEVLETVVDGDRQVLEKAG